MASEAEGAASSGFLARVARFLGTAVSLVWIGAGALASGVGADFFAATFLTAVFLATTFFAATFFAATFLAAVFLAARLRAGGKSLSVAAERCGSFGSLVLSLIRKSVESGWGVWRGMRLTNRVGREFHPRLQSW